jgi:hypothetical protein
MLTYKSDGLFPTEMNIGNLSDLDLEEFRSLCAEYDELINASPSDGAVNLVQFVSFANALLSEQTSYTLQAITSALNDYVRRHGDIKNTLKFRMTSERDYFIFSALKTLKTLRSIEMLTDEGLPECIYALARSVFENYMYACNINLDSSLFQEKLLPKVDEDNFEFDVSENGVVNYSRVLDKNTGKVKTIRVTLYELSKNIPYESDKRLYDVFYKTACQYVHVDILSAKTYFSATNPYDEINPALIALLITLCLTMLLLAEISKNRNSDGQFKIDIDYLCREVLKDRLLDSIRIANSDPDCQNAVLDIIEQRIVHQFD